MNFYGSVLVVNTGMFLKWNDSSTPTFFLIFSVSLSKGVIMESNVDIFGHLPPLKTKKGSSFKEIRMEGDQVDLFPLWEERLEEDNLLFLSGEEGIKGDIYFFPSFPGRGIIMRVI